MKGLLSLVGELLLGSFKSSESSSSACFRFSKSFSFGPVFVFWESVREKSIFKI